jgi:tetratricopeptide (TPR) repeat protein
MVISTGHFVLTPATGQSYSINNAAAGLEALHRGSYDDAIRLLTKAINDGNLPSDDLEFAYLNRGKAYLAKGDYANAVTDLKKATELKPADADARHALERALAGGAPAQNTFQYSSPTYRFALSLPAGWTVHEHADDPTGVRVEFHVSQFDVKKAMCNVVVQDTPTTARFSQGELNAEVSRGDAEAILRNYGTTTNNPTAVLNTGDIAKLGKLTVQKGDMTFQRSGTQLRAQLLLAFVPGRYYIVACAAPAGTFQDFAGDFDTILQSFSVIVRGD